MTGGTPRRSRWLPMSRFRKRRRVRLPRHALHPRLRARAGQTLVTIPALPSPPASLGSAPRSGTMIAKFVRGLSAAAGFFVLCATPSGAQFGAPPTSASNAGARSQVCPRLESQLAMIDRGTFEPARAEQIRRYEEASAKQQAELDRLAQQSQRLGCQGAGFFALFSGQSPQCGPLNNQIAQVRANLDRSLMDIQRLQGNSGEREGQRRAILTALGQNDCGPQYRQYANSGPGGFFEQLFGGSPAGAGADPRLAGTYRTLCVRACDGFYFPIS